MGIVNPNKFEYVYLYEHNNYDLMNFLYIISWEHNFIFADDDNWLAKKEISANVFKKQIEERRKYFGIY